MAKLLNPIPKNPIPPPPPQSAGWGARIERMFIAAFTGVFNSSAGVLTNIISWGFRDLLDDLEVSLIEISQPFADLIINNEAIPKEFKQVIREVYSGKNAIGAAVIMAIIGIVLSGGLTPFFQVLMERPTQLAKGAIKSGILDPQTAILVGLRSNAFKEVTDFDLSLSGLDNARINALKSLARQRLNVGELIRLMLRFPNDRAKYITELIAKGYDNSDIDELIAANQQYPNPQDLIRFAVRDALSDEVVRKYGYDEDQPASFEDDMQKAGFAPGQAKYFWRSHWNLPSVTDVLEMFHRLNFAGDPDRVTEGDVIDYLRIADYPEYWRKRLLRVTYSLATRVDIRRFFELGIWDRNRVNQEYHRLGYDDETAEALTQLAEKEARPAEKDLTRSAIETAYAAKQFNKQEALEGLTSIGYSEQEADLFLSLIDYKEQQKLLNEDLDRVEFLYINGELDSVGIAQELGKFNLGTEQLENLVQLWDVRKRKQISLPTQSELEEFYLNDIISIDEYENILRRKNFSSERITWTIKRADQIYQNRATKIAEETAKEQERLTLSASASEYVKSRNKIDVQIAEINLEIADIKVALYGIEDAEIIQEAKLQILQLQESIKALQLNKAQLKDRFTQ